MLKQVVVAAAHISDALPMGWRLAFANGEHSEYLAVLVDEFRVVIAGFGFGASDRHCLHHGCACCFSNSEVV